MVFWVENIKSNSLASQMLHCLWVTLAKSKQLGYRTLAFKSNILSIHFTHMYMLID